MTLEDNAWGGTISNIITYYNSINTFRYFSYTKQKLLSVIIMTEINQTNKINMHKITEHHYLSGAPRSFVSILSIYCASPIRLFPAHILLTRFKTTNKQ